MLVRWILLTLSTVVQFLLLSTVTGPPFAIGQEATFELPVQLIGFPVIILAVRMSNFVRKLAYSLTPSTYRRSARAIGNISTTEPDANIDVMKAEMDLIGQLGADMCVYENICLQHVQTAGTKTANDWQRIFREYSSVPYKKQQFYLLSIFLGDIIRSKKLCNHFATVGRNCQ